MQKRGQVTVFVIIGIVVILIIALFFFARNNLGIGINPQQFVESRLDPIRDNVKECIDKVVPEAVTSLGKQGGDFSPATYRRYQGQMVKYYCLNIPDENNCLNVMPTLAGIKRNLQEYMQFQISNCIDRSLLKSKYGYKVITGNPKTEVEFQGQSIEITIDYPVTITKGGATVQLSKVKRVYNDVPINDLYATAVDITNALATTGFFDQVIYMLQHRDETIIGVDKPYPDRIYKLQKRDSKYEWWFATQGEEMVA